MPSITVSVFNLVSTEVDGNNSMILLGICVPDKLWDPGFMQYRILESIAQSDTN